MKKRIILLVIAVFFLFGLTGCLANEPAVFEETTVSAQSATYEQITPEEAKKIMDTESDYVILDVRTQEEFDSGHIEGAILIPDYEIESKAESVLTDKDCLILVYCRSGRRSKLASEKLVQLGYINVKEFGGIIDWKYEIVQR